jgi:thymidine phosphorylase
MNEKLFHSMIHREQTHDFLHHIAEEELPACKVTAIKTNGMIVQFFADCRDKARHIGPQSDLSEKLKTRLDRHQIKGVPRFKVEVIHQPVSGEPLAAEPVNS